MHINGFNIAMVRGDSENFRVRYGRPFEEGETLYFTVRKWLGDSAIVLQKVVSEWEDDGSAIFQLVPEDTARLGPYVYVYDVRIKRGSHWTKTLIWAEHPDTKKRSTFTLIQEVTD